MNLCKIGKMFFSFRSFWMSAGLGRAGHPLHHLSPSGKCILTVSIAGLVLDSCICSWAAEVKLDFTLSTQLCVRERTDIASFSSIDCRWVTGLIWYWISMSLSLKGPDGQQTWLTGVWWGGLGLYLVCAFLWHSKEYVVTRYSRASLIWSHFSMIIEA